MLDDMNNVAATARTLDNLLPPAVGLVVVTACQRTLVLVGRQELLAAVGDSLQLLHPCHHKRAFHRMFGDDAG